MTVKLKNLSKDIIILEEVNITQNFFSRLKGLLGKKSLPSNQGLIIKPCNSIHTIGMKFAIDIAFIDKNHRVVHIINSMKPGKLSPIIKGASYLIEVNSGTFSDTNLEIGDLIEIRK